MNNYFTEMCSGSEAGSYLRLIEFVCHSTLGLRVIEKKRRSPHRNREEEKVAPKRSPHRHYQSTLAVYVHVVPTLVAYAYAVPTSAVYEYEVPGSKCPTAPPIRTSHKFRIVPTYPAEAGERNSSFLTHTVY